MNEAIHFKATLLFEDLGVSTCVFLPTNTSGFQGIANLHVWCTYIHYIWKKSCWVSLEAFDICKT
jgi:hypothetical protein